MSFPSPGRRHHGGKEDFGINPHVPPAQHHCGGNRAHAAKEPARVDIEATVRVSGKTGVEMEAMTAVSVAGLTIYDMCKAVDREMTIGEIRLVKKAAARAARSSARNRKLEISCPNA